jgi:glycosyltransferase involved in cell wall biosynthesis
MRIAHYYTPLTPADATARYVLRLAAAQEKAGHEVYLYTRPGAPRPVGRIIEEVHGDADLAQRVRHRGLDVLHTHCFVVRDLGLRKTRIVRTVHDHTDYCPSDHRYRAWGSTACESPLSGLGCVVGYLTSGCGLHRGPGAWLAALRSSRLQIRLARVQADVLIFASDYCKAAYTISGADVAHAPVLLRPAPARPAMQALESEVPRLAYWGPLLRRQGLEVLLEALASVAAPAELEIAGEGPLRGVLETKLRELGLGARVRLLGAVDPTQRAQLFERAWVHVLPVLWPDTVAEGLLEAAAMGRATVASRLGCLPEYVEPGVTGWLAKAGDVHQLAAALQRAVEDLGQTQRMGAEARARAVTSWSMEHHVQWLDDLYVGRSLG